MLVLLIIIEIIEHHDRNKHKALEKFRELKSEDKIVQSVLNSTVEHIDESNQKIKELKGDIEKLEESKRHFSNLKN